MEIHAKRNSDCCKEIFNGELMMVQKGKRRDVKKKFTLLEDTQKNHRQNVSRNVDCKVQSDEFLARNEDSITEEQTKSQTLF